MIYALVACVCLPMMLQAADVKVWLEPTTCTPGDVVELHAQLEGPEFAEFSLQIPKHEAVYLVSQQSHPASYNRETYRQKTVWQLQAMKPGAIELTGILATIQTGAMTREQAVAPQTLMVTAYETAEDTNAPLPLPDDATRAAEQSRIMAWVIAGAVLLIALWIVIMRNKRTHADHSEEADEPTLADLTTALEAGQQPLDMIDSVLNNARIELSQEARNALERAAYSKSKVTDINALLTLIRKEPSV